MSLKSQTKAVKSNSTLNYDRQNMSYPSLPRAFVTRVDSGGVGGCTDAANTNGTDSGTIDTTVFQHATFNKEKTDRRGNFSEKQYSNEDPSLVSDSTVSSSSEQHTPSSSGIENCDEFVFSSIPSIEKDLEFILENRDLNPYYELNDDYDDDDDNEREFNVEDYLVDLDEYLDELDKTTEDTSSKSEDVPETNLSPRIGENSTLPRKRATIGEFNRLAPTRNTISILKDNRGKNTESGSRLGSLWLRKSMRKTKLIDIPSHSNASSNPEERSRLVNFDQDLPLFSNLIDLSQGQREVTSGPVVQEEVRNSASPIQSVTVPPLVVAMDNLNDFNAYNHIRFEDNPPTAPGNGRHLEEMTIDMPRESPHREETSTVRNEDDLRLSYITETINENSPRRTMPRQLGRRSEHHPRVVAINAEAHTITISRPNSAPARVSAPVPNFPPPRVNRYQDSVGSSVASSRNPSPVSLISSSGSSSVTSAQDNANERRNADTLSTGENNSADDEVSLNKIWPHDLASAMAIICCTLGLFNMSRFAIFSVHFGANFIVQFLILSVIFGIPMVWLQMCLGAKIQKGPVGMWAISPISRGIGIVLLMVQGLVALYTAVSIAWLLIYFRDSFVSRSERYRWEDPIEIYRGPLTNESWKLAQTIPDYFNGVVLQRYNIGPGGRAGNSGIGKVRFQLSFNLSIFWTLVFIVLCKGLRSYGKFVFGLIMIPIIGLTIFSTKLLLMIDFSSIENIFPATDWQDFFINTHSWVSAGQETFLTWGLFGASVLSMSSHTTKKKPMALRRDAFFVVIITLYGLIMAAIIGNACVQIIKDNGYLYFPGSYETVSYNTFLYPISQPLPPQLVSIPSKWLPRYSTILGEMFKRPGAVFNKESGYQVLRLVTEIMPAAFGSATQSVISPWWCLLGYSSLLILAIGQFCAIWKPIASVLGNNPSAALLSCVTGLLIGIPLSTEGGIVIVHYLDMVIGGAWWIMIIWFAQIIAVFLIRGSPYTGDLIIHKLKLADTFSMFVALSWNIILPIGLMVLCVYEYHASDSNKFLHWRGVSYWPLWARKIAGIIQITFIQIVPMAAIIQIYRYLSRGPPDILERIQLLYRPDLENTQPPSGPPPARIAASTPVSPAITRIPLDVPMATTIPDDVPPKYTPPPSYTTATGARIAKMLRQSIRRSVRRLMGEPGNSRGPRGNLSDHITALNNSTNATNAALPATYNSMGADLSLRTLTNPCGSESIQPADEINNLSSQQPSLQRNTLPHDKNIRRMSPTTSCGNFLHRPHRHPSSSNNRSLSLSACVDQLILRSSFRHNVPIFNGQLNRGQQSRSLENLVLNTADLGQSSLVTLDRNDSEGHLATDSQSQRNRQHTDKNCNNLTPSVI